MSRCIQLAKNGLGTTYPNPLVGSVVVHNDQIIGEGWHHRAGEPHAEVLAIKSVTNRELLKDATLYVNLEPCSHYGKTPPCSDLIISKGIKKVVIGSTDTNPKVAGSGIQKLLNAGCEVLTGVLEKESDGLNKRFFTFHGKKRPYVFLKWAQSLDGFIAPEKQSRTETKPVWITNPYSRQLAHKIRSEEMAILVGTTTVLEDNPSLTVREWSGKNPIRAVIDKESKLPKNASIFDESSKTLVFTATKNIMAGTSEGNVKFFGIDFSKEIAGQICEVLYNNNIQSLIVEGGTKTLQTFIDADLWDEAHIFSGNARFGKGILAPSLQGDLESEVWVKGDRLQFVKNEYAL